ncbi:polysaccharide biosynthesis tyrosine autokinase [Nocardioides pinisoli]|uniref:Polysaccharide biosynthesis tyrosine autokinase n=1 Tax=Nocardioides pinisoli TaxID=2950279 RepID=A0ABT1KU71_9ACTN|nr:polysaccharide biosynthesis tyrosine autokinase [Nocardioides pinisoli]MCP3420929.1 polysaccharide biosynthesis tyrosine autokinase [Nocardioides pinisoli]
MELQDYWRTVRRRWRLVLGSVLVVLAVAAVWTWTVTPLYSSTTRIFVSTSQTDENSAYTGNLFATQRVASYADLVTSNQLAERVATELGDAEPMDLREQVTASAVPETVLLEIAATDPDRERARDIAQAYAEQLQLLVEELETPRGETTAVVKATLIDDAQIPASPVSPQPLRNLALAGVLGLLLGVGLAVARELLDTSVKGADDIAEITTAPVLGNIFQDNDAKRAPHEVLFTATPWAEAFRVLRTNMQYVDVDHDQKVLVVTSSLPGEGKSTTAVNLAVTLTQAGQKVALVECDLRRPLIADRLELDGSIGTTSVLIGKVSADDVMQPYADTTLDVMVCGQIPPNPSELLQSQAMEAMLEDLRSRYDVVVLDAPPLLPVTDAALLATRADGAVVVVSHGRTTRDQLSTAIERLGSVGATTLGLVVNQTPAKKSASGYGYGYGYAPLDEPPQGGGGKRRRR